MHVEFTIEPFVEGRPGRHVTAGVEAVRQLGVDVELGPFGSSCVFEPDRVGAVLRAVADAAVAGGASHLTIHVAVDDGRDDVGADEAEG